MTDENELRNDVLNEANNSDSNQNSLRGNNIPSGDSRASRGQSFRNGARQAAAGAAQVGRGVGGFLLNPGELMSKGIGKILKGIWGFLRGWVKFALLIFVIFLVVTWGFPLIIGMIPGANTRLTELGINGIKDIPTYVAGLFKNIDTEVNSQIDKQNKAMTGEYYESEVDEYANKDLGIYFMDFDTSETWYRYDDKVAIWGIIEAETMNNKDVNLTLECYLENSKTKQKLIDGTIDKPKNIITEEDIAKEHSYYSYPVENKHVSTFRSQSENDFHCEFPRGVFDEGTNNVYVKAKYNFETRTYFKTTFMDGDSLRNINRDNPEFLADIDEYPAAQNTKGPVQIGMSTKKMPIAIGEKETEPTLGISISNEDEGKINEIKNLQIITPIAIEELLNCDYEFEKINSENNLNFYKIKSNDLSVLNSRINSMDEDEFESQNIKCTLIIDKDKILEGSSVLNPVTESIFVNIEYEYEVEEKINVAIQERTGFVVQLTNDNEQSFNLELGSRIECEGRYYGDETVSDGEYWIKVIDNYESDTEQISENSEMRFLFCDDSNRCNSGSLDLRDIMGNDFDIHEGQKVSCLMKIKLQDGSNLEGLRYGTIINSAPEIDEMDFYPDNPDSNSNIECRATVYDGDYDYINATVKITIEDNEKIDKIICSKESIEGYYRCSYIIQASEISSRDYVKCEIAPTDGKSAGDSDKISIRISSEETGTTAIDSEELEKYCSETDGGNAPMTKGKITGYDHTTNDYITLEDTCNGNILVEYYCNEDGKYIESENINVCSSCTNGACSGL